MPKNKKRRVAFEPCVAQRRSKDRSMAPRDNSSGESPEGEGPTVRILVSLRPIGANVSGLKDFNVSASLYTVGGWW